VTEVTAMTAQVQSHQAHRQFHQFRAKGTMLTVPAMLIGNLLLFKPVTLKLKDLFALGS